VLAAMEDTQVEGQHRQHENVKEDPENPVGWHEST
jgi:hypothetical protein